MPNYVGVDSDLTKNHNLFSSYSKTSCRDKNYNKGTPVVEKQKYKKKKKLAGSLS